MMWWLAMALAQEAEPEPTEEADDAAEDADGEAADPEPGPEEPLEASAPAAPPVLVIPAYGLREGLATLATASAEEAASDQAMLGSDALKRLEGIDWEGPAAMVRGRWYMKPVITADTLERDGNSSFAIRVGGALGRMWFTTGSLPVQAGVDVGLHASAPIGHAVGYRLQAHGLAGPWLGPVGLRAGPTVRFDRSRWTLGGQDQLLDDALLVGGRTTLAVDAGPVAPYVSIEPAWVITGDRVAPSDPVLPVLGTETRYGAGLNCQANLLLLGIHVHRNETAIGGVNQVGMSVTVRPPSNTKRGDE